MSSTPPPIPCTTSCSRQSHNMHFRATDGPIRRPNSVLIYRHDEFSFDVEPAPIGAFTSVLINTVSLELDVAGQVISVWGLCPYSRWKPANLKPSNARSGDVFCVTDAPLVRGVSLQMTDECWPVFADASSGWVRVTGKSRASSSTEILPGIILDIDQRGQLSALWLKPQKLPNFRSSSGSGLEKP